MARYVVVFQKLLLQIPRQLVESRARVGVLCRAAGAFGRQLVCAEETVASSAWVEGAVDVEEGVALLS